MHTYKQACPSIFKPSNYLNRGSSIKAATNSAHQHSDDVPLVLKSVGDAAEAAGS